MPATDLTKAVVEPLQAIVVGQNGRNYQTQAQTMRPKVGRSLNEKEILQRQYEDKDNTESPTGDGTLTRNSREVTHESGRRKSAHSSQSPRSRKHKDQSTSPP